MERINNLNTLAENKKKVYEVHKEGLLKIKNDDCKNICLLKRAIQTLVIMVNVTHTGRDANIQSWLGCLFLAQGHRESLEMGKRAT